MKDFLNQRIGIKQIAIIVAIVLMVLFIILWIIDYFVMPPIVHSINVVKVPNITGLTLSNADPVIRESKLRIAEVREVYSETVPKGQIISQLPFAGSEVREGRRLYIAVSRGIEKVMVPSLLGKTDREATLNLLSIGLQIGEINYEEDDSPYGTVLTQSIRSGERIPYGRSVSITVSQGPQGVDVAAFTGITLYQARLLAGEYNLILEITNWTDADQSIPEDQIFIEPNIERTPQFLKNGDIIWVNVLTR